MPPKKKIETVQEEKAEGGTPVKKARNGKAKAKPEENSAEGEEVAASPVLTKKEKAAISAEKNGAHIRDIVTPKVLESDHKFLKIISWNVNGFKALVANNLHILTNLIANHKPDILCLQETKLQTSQVNEFRHILEGYESHWSCSTVKNGYSGTAVFINKSTVDTKSVNGTTATGDGAAAAAPPSKKKQATMSAFFKKTTVSGGTVEETSSAAAAVTVAAAAASTSATAGPVVQLQRISYDFEDEKKSFSGEGRTITLEFNNFILVACYVPNSGEGLVRLDYRTKQWDPWVREYLTRLHQRKPVVYTGDLNVGYLDLDIHNPTAKHIDKQAGLTPQERQSHGELLSTTGFKDAFRYFYPDARGQFTYWSQRTFARPVNRGIRLDYFLCSGDMFKTSTAAAAAADSKATEVEEEEVKSGVNVPARRVEVSLQDTPSPGVYDSYQLPDDTKGCSDHGPVVLVVKV